MTKKPTLAGRLFRLAAIILIILPIVNVGILSFLASLDSLTDHHQASLGILTIPTTTTKNATMSNNTPTQDKTSSSPLTMKNKPKTLIMGAIRDCAPFLIQFRQKLLPSLQRELDVVGLVLLENDSVDDTVAELQPLSSMLSLMHIEHPNVSHLPTKEERLVVVRNRLWQIARNLSSTTTNASSSLFDYVLMLDMDEANMHLRGVHRCTTDLPDDWMVCCANSYTIYYDLYAARSVDRWITLHRTSDGRISGHRKNFRHIDARTSPPIPMQSCFNGAALYKWKSMQASTMPLYGHRMYAKKHRVCEHVPFHLGLASQNPNGKIYILPSMLNDGPHWARTRKFYWNALSSQTRDEINAINKSHPFYIDMDWNLYEFNRYIVKE